MPRVASLTDAVALSVGRAGASEGEHGVRIDTEPHRPSSFDWFPDQAAAITSYEARVREYREHDGPILVRIRRIEHNQTMAEEFVVSRPPTFR